MQADKTTLNDLSIFAHNEEQSVFHHINFTRTVGGKEWLKHFLHKPLRDIRQINETQEIIKSILAVKEQWPEKISNGTIMVMERFYETPIEEIPAHPNAINAFFYKLLHGPDYSLVRYSVSHFIDFMNGLAIIFQLLSTKKNPEPLHQMLQRIAHLLNKPMVQVMVRPIHGKPLSSANLLHFGYFIRRHFKHEALELIDIYNKLDAYYGMAAACKEYNFVFPEFIELAEPFLEAQQVFHPLISVPVAYNVELSSEKNFLFLTGANMAGKSTFIKTLGIGVYLAHIGMGVPAAGMKLSVFDGVLSNIQVVDNIMNGESYFYNEVQRIKKTIEKINDGKKWLILIDELFKGTNVQDAMKCSIAVIEGLRKMNNALFILSTHLYEIGVSLQQYPNIQFRYFETAVENGQLIFSYHLKEGVSNDRLGYLILQREGVVGMLEKL